MAARSSSTSADHNSSETTKAAPARRSSGRWLLRFLMLIAVVAGLIAALPSLATRTPLRNRLLAWATRGMNGALTVGDASFGWLSPLVLRDVQLTDAEGHVVVRIPSIDGDKRLCDLLWLPHELGHFRVAEPQVQVILRADGSNLEDIVAPLLNTHDSPSQSPHLAVQVDVTDAQVTVTELESRQQWQLRQSNLQLSLGGNDSAVAEVYATGAIQTSDGGGPFQSQLTLRQATDAQGRTVPVGRLIVKTQDFPLGLTQLVLRRLQSSLQIAGRLSSDLQCEWGLDQAGRVRQSVQGQVSLRRFELVAPKLLVEPLRLAQVDVPCNVTWENNQLRIPQLQATCDAGQLVVQSELADADRLLDQRDIRELLRVLAQGSNQVQLRIDLAQLARLLPQTLKVRDDTQLTSGLLDLELTSRREPAGNTWLGRVETSRLEAVHQGRPVSWEQPLRIAFAARDEQRGLVVDRVQCQSDFIRLEGAGSPDSFQLGGTLDLQRLVAELGKFVDLSNVKLLGQGALQTSWERQPDRSFRAGGQLNINGFELTAGGATPWTEQKLELNAALQGKLDAEEQFQVITAGQVVLVSGDDRMSGTLRSPVTHPSTGSIWPVDVAVQGKLASWTRRLTPVVGALPSLALDGQLQASVTGQWSASAVELDKSEITVQSLTVRGMGLFIDEPQARLVANGRWDANSGRLDLRQLSLETSAVAVQSRDSRLGLSAASAHETQGELSLDGNINKLTDWFRDPTQPRFWEVSGALHGRAVLTNQGGKAGAAIDLNAENVLATPRGSRQWHEPSIRLTAMTDYDAKADVLTISQSELKSEMLTLQCAGQIQPAGSTRQVQLEGHLSYDLAKVQRLLQPYTGTGLQLAGAKTTPFSVAGPLTAPAGLPSDQATTAWVRQFVGRGEIGWDWINAYGMQVGRGTLAMELRDGVLNCAPVDLAVGNGRVHLAPVVNLTSAATELQMPAGVVVDHVELSPEMCRQAVGYVAPLLAGVTQSQGEISLALDACRIPLAQPTTGDAIGRLTLHTVQVSSGPIIQEMASLIGTTAALQAKPDCEVQFRMVNGRVYHQGLELSMPGITLRTQGSVGFDQSLALLVDMPIPAQWLAQTGLTTQLQNQALRVPLAGTLSRPALDGGEVQRQLGQFLGRASSGLIENGINRGLQNLLGPTGGLMNNPKR